MEIIYLTEQAWWCEDLKATYLSDNETISEHNVQAGHCCRHCKGRQAEEPPTAFAQMHCQMTEMICTCLNSYTLLFTCSRHGALQVGMKTSCDGCFSSYICGQLLSLPWNAAASSVSAVTWEDTSSWVSTLHQQDQLGYILAGEWRDSCITPGFVSVTIS